MLRNLKKLIKILAKFKIWYLPYLWILNKESLNYYVFKNTYWEHLLKKLTALTKHREEFILGSRIGNGLFYTYYLEREAEYGNLLSKAIELCAQITHKTALL